MVYRSFILPPLAYATNLKTYCLICLLQKYIAGRNQKVGLYLAECTKSSVLLWFEDSSWLGGWPKLQVCPCLGYAFPVKFCPNMLGSQRKSQNLLGCPCPQKKKYLKPNTYIVISHSHRHFDTPESRWYSLPKVMFGWSSRLILFGQFIRLDPTQIRGKFCQNLFLTKTILTYNRGSCWHGHLQLTY